MILIFVAMCYNLMSENKSKKRDSDAGILVFRTDDVADIELHSFGSQLLRWPTDTSRTEWYI
jgi:hypothetical protein